jgi:mono/diheme cytochrome c family protein
MRNIMRISVVLRRVAVPGALAVCLAAIAGSVNGASAMSDYTADQAARGAKIYDQFCTTCHGSNLEGKAGPPLTGKPFQETLQYANMTTSQLYAFISQSMPQNAPASLSGEQYIDALSFLLSKNGYPAGSTPLSQERLGEIALLPVPAADGNVAAQH